MGITLRPHQQIACDFLTTRRAAALYLRMSFGKTLTTLAAIDQIRPAGNILVVAPKTIARDTWMREVQKWQMPVRTRSLVVDDKGRGLTANARRELVEQINPDEPAMYFINVELLPWLVEQFAADPEKLTWRFPGIMQQSDQVDWPFPTVVVDESQILKNHTSKRFAAMACVRPHISWFIELTGTPMPNSYLELWAQLWLLDAGRALGPTFEDYRDFFFYARPNRAAHIPPTYKPQHWAPDAIHQRIGHLVMSDESADLQLKGLVEHEHLLTLDEETFADYETFRDTMVLELIAEARTVGASNQDDRDESNEPNEPDGSSDTTAISPFADFMVDPAQNLTVVDGVNSTVLRNKLLQMASGTLYLPREKDAEGKPVGGPRQYVVIHDAKVQAVHEILQQTDTPVLIAYNFVCDATELVDRLGELGHEVAIFDKTSAMIDAWNNREVPVMLLHPKSAGHGLNLQYGGNTIIWYTLPWSPEAFDQTNARLNRTGQLEPVDVHVLLTRDTYDTEMPKVIGRKSRQQEGLKQATQVDLERLAADILRTRGGNSAELQERARRRVAELRHGQEHR